MPYLTPTEDKIDHKGTIAELLVYFNHFEYTQDREQIYLTKRGLQMYWGTAELTALVYMEDKKQWRIQFKNGGYRDVYEDNLLDIAIYKVERIF